MASKFLGVLGLLALASRSMAGVATYAHSPYAAYQLPAQATVYHQQPFVYHAAAPVYKSPASAIVQSYHAPLVRTYAAAPVAHAVAPVVKTYSTAPLINTYAAAPAHVVAAPAVVKTVASAPLVAAPVVTKTAAVVSAAPAIVKTVEYDSAPRYDFSYGVHDSLTGDIKSQVESRNGGNVAGSYSVVDADGYKRTVTYTADDLNGFNAVVQREPIVKLAAVAAAVPVATPIHHVPLQQNVQYYPAQQQIQQQYLPQAPALPAQHVPESEPVPIEYPEQQQPSEQQYPQDQNYPPYPQQEIDNNDSSNVDDSDIVEARSANGNGSSSPSSTPASAPVVEDQKDSIPPKRTA